MNDDYIIIRQDQKSTSNLRKKIFLILGSVIVLLVIIIGIIVFILTRSSKQPEVVVITNYEEIAETLPQSTYENLSAQLYYLLSNHFEVPNISKSISAVLRLETFTTTNDGDFSGAEVVVDIDEYEQTYLAGISWANQNSQDLPVDILISCTRKELAKYPAAECFGMYDNSDSVQLYLPYTETLSSGANFTAKFNYYDNNGIEIVLIELPNCSDDNLQTEAIFKTREYIRQNGLDPDKYIFEAPLIYQNCRL